jgi:hypothetical protein
MIRRLLSASRPLPLISWKGQMPLSGRTITDSHPQHPEAIRCVRNWLSEHRPHNSPPLPGAPAMQKDYRLFQKEIPATLKRLQLPTNISRLTHNDFLFAVRDWIAARTL